MSNTENCNWTVEPAGYDGTYMNEQAILCVLQDIRRELQSINRVLNCGNTLRIPRQLERIARNTSKRRKRRKP